MNSIKKTYLLESRSYIPKQEGGSVLEIVNMKKQISLVNNYPNLRRRLETWIKKNLGSLSIICYAALESTKLHVQVGIKQLVNKQEGMLYELFQEHSPHAGDIRLLCSFYRIA